MKNLRNILVTAFVIALVMIIHSCTSADEYLKFTEGGEISYVGKIDSLKFFPGRNRVKIQGLIISDPKVTELRVYWNNKKDSVVVPINRTSGVDVVSTFIENLPENIYNFEVKTFDAKGNSSISQNVTAQTYGERYQASLTDRKIIASNLYAGDFSLTIDYATMDLTTGAYATEIVYTDNSNVEHTVTVPVATSQIVIPNYKNGSQFKQRSLFLPTPTAIDVFYTDFVVSAIPTITYMKNFAVPFKASASSGRWGNLADWTTNDAAKNHGGYGGWDKNNGNIFNLESGWGAPLIANGKVYQTVTLSPGTYTFKANPKAKGTGIDSGYTTADFVYLVVAQGNTLPDSSGGALETNSATLGFTRMVKTMSPSQAVITFTLTEQKQVSFGISTTQGDQRYCNITSFSFVKN